MDIFIYPYLPWIVGGGLALGALGIAGWVFTTWMRIKHGYPLENAWGMAVHPKVSTEAQERITLLTNENVQLRAELGSVKDRLATVERIVTDGSFRLENEIEQLRGTKN
ncbi:hypothetical protein [Sphingosinicella sp.]|jgi:hypothetical protein|uniref:hypothetical protein n=1 Tax=Sphingosinicella sp. TaxID=1917971 RepID=UPI00183AE2C0|nr:hypothetical protein [Sphingosinicella sp.]MBA4759272.1 hypothetical protein [Sphingosinicella sp.]MEA3538944.1 hypothetical protein [Pseudomonadota bacterium]